MNYALRYKQMSHTNFLPITSILVLIIQRTVPIGDRHTHTHTHCKESREAEKSKIYNQHTGDPGETMV